MAERESTSANQVTAGEFDELLNMLYEHGADPDFITGPCTGPGCLMCKHGIPLVNEAHEGRV